MAEELDTGLGYCSNCKRFGKLSKLYDIEANIPMIKSAYATEEGLFLDNEAKFNRNTHGWLGVTIHAKAFKSCEFVYADDEKTVQVCKLKGKDQCPFHVVGFEWGCDTHYLIDCDCLHKEFINYIELKKHASEICPCDRYDEFSDFSNVEYNSVRPIIVEDVPSAIIVQQKLPGEHVIPIILKATTFIHVITYNVDNYFLGILQTLAVRGVDVIIALNPGTLTKGNLRKILNITSFSRGNLQIIINSKVHAKRIFIDGIYDLDLSSINLSYKALYNNIENIPELSFAIPSLSEKNWEIIKATHSQKFLSTFREGRDLFEWCREAKPDLYEECSKAFARRLEEMELIEKMRSGTTK